MSPSESLETRAGEAGRELDALVAEKVMGFRYERVAGVNWWEDRLYGSEDAGGLWIVRASDASPDYRDGLPRYSQDIAASFLVVEKMHERFAAFSSSTPGEIAEPWPDANYLILACRGRFGLANNGGWAAAFTCVDHVDVDGNEWFERPERYRGAVGETPAHAICLAALAALDLSSPSTE